MIDKVSWLHISDLHLQRQSASWSQDVVLRALHDGITKLRASKSVNFVVATGDLSYSGKDEEFSQVEAFFKDVLSDLCLTPNDLFVVAGNHDNDLSLQKYSVVGARTTVTGSGAADDLVGDVAERDQILTRQVAYRKFVSRFFPDGLYKNTPDGLAYVATKALPPFRISIVGLNSAWLCQSGQKDRGNVVIGERQVIEAINAVHEQRPHLVIALIHHPMHWLCAFEHTAIENRLKQVCDFVLRGHLHETDVQTHAVGDRKCMFIAAGASFETRASRNSFNYVELDIGQGTCTITSFNYIPKTGEFSEAAPQSSVLAFRHLPKPNPADLVAAIVEVAPGLAGVAAYLTCLLRGDKSEFLAFDDSRAVFLSLDALDGEGAASLKGVTRSFMTLRHLCTFSESKPALLETLCAYRNRLCDYGERLISLAAANSTISEALAGRDLEAKTYITATSTTTTRYTAAALRDLRRVDDLVTLKRLAIRSSDDPDPEVRRESLRGLALVDARSSIPEERERAVGSLRALCESPEAIADDFASLINLLVDLSQLSEAKDRIRTAIRQFPEKVKGFSEIGMAMVQKTGDRDFRDELLQRHPARGA